MNLHDLGFDNRFLIMTPRAQEDKRKNRYSMLQKNQKLLCIKRPNQRNVKTANRMREKVAHCL